MVRFGAFLLAHEVPGWEEYYMNYKMLRKAIKAYEGRAATASEEERQTMLKGFSALLDNQVEKTVLFFLEEQGHIAGRLQKLQVVREELTKAITESDAIAVVRVHPRIGEVMEQYRDEGRKLLQLLQFMEINATGIRKILKKFDRRIGMRLGAMYLESRTQHPHSQLQQVFRQVGLGAILGTIMRNLGELHRLQHLGGGSSKYRYSSFDIFARPQISEYLVEEEPVIKEIQAAQQTLTKAVTFGTFVANELLLPPPEKSLSGEVVEEEPEFHWLSLQLNQVNTFIYMVNYYIIIPTSDEYAEVLRAPGSLCGVIIGSMPFCAIISALVYSKWSNSSYQQPLYLSTLVLILGNILYAAAFDFDAVWMLLVGRALAGLGGARAINRRYISDHVPTKMRTVASAAFVSASALGMAVGPAMAGLLNLLNVKVLGFTINAVTSPGWLMTFLWLAYLVALAIFFKEPPHRGSRGREREGDSGSGRRGRGSHGHNNGKAEDLEAPLLRQQQQKLRQDAMSAISELSETTDHDLDDEDDVKPVETLGALAKEMTVPVQVLLFIYFMIKLAQEVLVSQSSLVTKFYFDWQINSIGIFLAVLGGTVLPMSALVGNYISNIYEDRLVLFWTQAFTGVGVLGILSFSPWLPYSTTQYVIAAVIIYVAANVTEGVNMSLLSRVMSPALARGTFNCGLLSTEAGTFARVVGDGLITLIGGSLGTAYVLNWTMLPVLVTVIVSVGLTSWRYSSLF
eukprot:TRINITY_DN16802_c0_g1_i1.p1 TRINITY_DN16802_c0_g1~~TRINITY_DN16802_c0_g1_i1.p1  ORF type:complete len:740 (+),score=168.01 TRINITY_DN16802_c0_g1_i1:199-2418(+)